jgi:polar amino acid transport system permease protein
MSETAPSLPTDSAKRAAVVAPTVDVRVPPEPNRPVPVRYPGRVLSAVLIVFVVVVATHSMATNDNFAWDVVADFLFSAQVLRGVVWTLALTGSAMLLAILLAVALVFMRRSENSVLNSVAWAWIWFFRGTPLYTQLVFWGLLGVLYPTIALGVPFGGPTLFNVPTTALVTPVVAAIVGLGFNESAYLAEIFRAGFNSVDSGQVEAAHALGMRRTKATVRIVLPQAMRVIIPPTGNETIGMLKSTSLVLAIPFGLDLTFTTNAIANRLYLPVPLLIVAATWYLAITSVLMVGQYFLERHFGRGVDPQCGRAVRSFR